MIDPSASTAAPVGDARLHLLRRGLSEPGPARSWFAIGPLSLRFEDGDLRAIRVGETEIVRRLYAAVRDRDWGTVPAVISELSLAHDEAGLRIAYTATHRQGDIHFVRRMRIAVSHGDGETTLNFAMDGEARSTFWRNRIGICVLHPTPACAGTPCAVEHLDGTVEPGFFPRFIAPHQPFLDIRAITVPAGPGATAQITFSGDSFEMEDQRNWGDSSFKTYSTPVAARRPVEVPTGTRIAQAVTICVRGGLPAAAIAPRIAIIAAGASTPLPGLGLYVPQGPIPRAEDMVRLKRLGLSHLRVDLDLGQPTAGETWRRAVELAQVLGLPLDAGLLCSDRFEAELAAFATTVGDAPVRTWLVLPADHRTTPSAWIDAGRRLLAAASGAAVGGGSRGNFTDLNRDRPAATMDVIAYALNSQVHASDDSSVMENAVAQGETMRSARRFAGATPVIAAVALRSRPAADHRQASLLAAGWTALSIKHLAEAGAKRLVHGDTTGPLGVIADSGEAVPLYHVLADLGEFAGGSVLIPAASEPTAVDALVVRHRGRCRALVVNLTPEVTGVELTGLAASALVKPLDETTAAQAIAAPEAWRAKAATVSATRVGRLALTLLPYAVIRVDWDS